VVECVLLSATVGAGTARRVLIPPAGESYFTFFHFVLLYGGWWRVLEFLWSVFVMVLGPLRSG